MSENKLIEFRPKRDRKSVQTEVPKNESSGIGKIALALIGLRDIIDLLQASSGPIIPDQTIIDTVKEYSNDDLAAFCLDFTDAKVKAKPKFYRAILDELHRRVYSGSFQISVSIPADGLKPEIDSNATQKKDNNVNNVVDARNKFKK